MKLLDRIAAAGAAFKDPGLVGEARGLRNVVSSLYDRCGGNGVCILRAEPIGSEIWPRYERLSWRQGEDVLRFLGWLP